MSFSATRLTLYAILSSIESDLRNIITSELESHIDVETVIGSDVWPGAKDRFIKEAGVFGEKPSLKEILYYVDFGDLYMILNRHKAEISLSAQNYIKTNTKKFEDLVPIRNRVAHSRPLLFEDFPKVWDVAEDLIENFSDFSKDVGYVLQKIHDDPSYVLSLTLQRRFALQRRFEYYYDMSRESLKFPSYTLWRMLPKGDRHETDYSISVAFDSSATGQWPATETGDSSKRDDCGQRVDRLPS